MLTFSTQHKPGVKASPADHAPEFSAKTLPPGSAPADRTFQPNATSEVPGQADNDATLRSHGKESTYTTADSTLGGSTSAAVHTGLGHPGQGQTATEIRHEGKHKREREGAGLEGVGATGGSGMVDERVTPSQRALERDEAASGQRGDKTLSGAEDGNLSPFFSNNPACCTPRGPSPRPFFHLKVKISQRMLTISHSCTHERRGGGSRTRLETPQLCLCEQRLSAAARV